MCGIAAVLGIAASGTLLAANGLKNKFNEISAEEVSYKMVAGKDQFAALGTSFARVGGFAMSSSTGTAVQVNVVNGKKDGNNLVLGKLGKVFNFGPSSTNYYSAITSIKSVKVTFSSGDLSLKLATRKDGLEMGQPVALISGTAVAVTKGGVNYFSLDTVAGATIESIEVVYSCTETSYDSVDYLAGTSWTAKDSSGYTYRLACGSSTFSIDSLDKETADHFEGTYERVEAGKIKATFTVMGGAATVQIVFKENSSHSSLTFDSVSDNVGGAAAAGVAHFNFKRVYMIEDFESYSETGTGYTASNAESNRSGLQGAFFADYGGGGSGSPVGTSGFQLMGSTDFIQLDKTNKYEGNQAGKFKGSTGGWMRYWGYDQLIGEPFEAGRGAYISMWVKNNSSVSAKLKWGSMKTYDPLNDTTRNSLDYATPTIAANQGWTEYTVPLTGTSYGWYLGIEKTTGSAAYLSIDNVCIYTDSPYVEYEAPVVQAPVLENTYKSSAHIGALDKDYSYEIALGNNGVVTVKVSGEDAQATDYTYDATTHKVTISTAGGLYVSQLSTTLPYGNIEGTYNETTGEIENISFTGAIGTYITNNGSMKATRGQLELRCDGTDAELQQTFRRRYDNGSGWQWDDGNADRIKANSNAAQGSSSLKFRYMGNGNANQKSALTLREDVQIANVSDITFWCLNDTGADFTIRLFVYKAASMGSNSEVAQITIPASTEWAFFQVGVGSYFTTGSLYNFQFFVASSPAANFYPSFDNIVIF